MKSTNDPADTFSLPAKPKHEPKPKEETWTQTETKGIERNQDGKLRTNIPEKFSWPCIYAPEMLDALDIWQC